MSDKESGGTGMELFWGFFVVFTLLFLWIQNEGPSKARNEGFFVTPAVITPSSNTSPRGISGQTTSRDSQSNSSLDSTDSTVSPYRGQIRLSSGTARSEYQPNREYVVITASGNKVPIKLAGWVLKNGRDKKQYVVSGNTVQGQSVSVALPEFGYGLYHPYDLARNKREVIALASGEKALIITGSYPSFGSIKVKDNFKSNRCLGYLEDSAGYSFYPRLSYRCPSSNDTPGISYLDDTCYDFVRSIRACHEPKDIVVKDEGLCLDGNCRLSSACREFVKRNFNFEACFNLYSRDDDFVAPEWRVFLNRPWELWEDRRETISLYDHQGRLVDELSY